jgi:hypothetical protein
MQGMKRLAPLAALFFTTFAAVVSTASCDKKSATTDPTPISKPPRPTLDRISRAEWNRLAAELALPLFWIEDSNKNGALDPKELAVYWGLDRNAKLTDFVDSTKGDPVFTPKLLETYERIVKHREEGGKGDDARKKSVKKELAAGRVTLVATDLSKADPAERAFAEKILHVAELIETLYAKQMGVLALVDQVPADDPASKILFFRGQGPKCESPATASEKECGALPPEKMPKPRNSGLYPADLLAANASFCDDLLKKKGQKDLLDPFTVVVADDKGTLSAKPYPEAWPNDMRAIASELDAAAQALGDKEGSLVTYVKAAAKAFRDNLWWPADEAWARMDAKSSKYFLRVGPDEVYAEPCSTKALFHLTFALVNQGSLKWQAKLDPLKTEMENALAALAGPPYKARSVTFKLPDFIDVSLYAGDARRAFGATIGQSLPNFGPVANEGRGRTVVMTNFYTDPDSIATSKEQAESLFCKASMERWTSAPDPQTMSTVLHEAAHNLGPAHQYKADGKIDREAFGGPLASTLEELKAQTAALYFTEWLIEKKELAREEADAAHLRDVFWAFGHISRGMYDDSHHPKNYSQLAAIQLGTFQNHGAVTWRPDETAMNGKDKGCFQLDFVKLPPSIKTLMIDVAQIKGRGDKARAEALIKDHVDMTSPGAGDKKKMHEIITERMTRAPKASFVYSVKL